MNKLEWLNDEEQRPAFVIRGSSFLRHPAFVIRHYLISRIVKGY